MLLIDWCLSRGEDRTIGGPTPGLELCFSTNRIIENCNINCWINKQQFESNY